MRISLLHRSVLVVDGWATRSQQGSRRNAMVALTALTQRRAELTEVEEYLASRNRARASVTDAAERRAVRA